MIEPWYREFARRLQEARLNAGLNQTQVAKLIRVDRVTLTNIECGRQRVKAHHALQLADTLGFELPEIIRFELRPVLAKRRRP